MITNAPSPAWPRAKRKPSPRNTQIYEAVRLAGERQADVAARHGLTQRRVSAICRQVDEWQRWASTAPNHEQLADEQKRTALLQARQRSERLLLTALKQAARKRERLVSEERRIVRGEEVVIERTMRELPIDPAWLKLAGGASRDILRFTEQLGPDVEPSQTLAEVDELLAALGAEEEGEGAPAQEGERGREGEGERSLLPEAQSKPEEGAKYSRCSKTYGESGPDGALISAAPVAETRCADLTCGDISGGAKGEKREEKNERFIASQVFYDPDSADGPTSEVSPATQASSDTQARLPREVRERRAKFLRG